jgi:hypothetical protein
LKAARQEAAETWAARLSAFFLILTLAEKPCVEISVTVRFERLSLPAKVVRDEAPDQRENSRSGDKRRNSENRIQ